MELLVRHNSRELFYRSPFGAAPCATAIELRLTAEGPIRPSAVKIRLWSTSDGEKFLNLDCETEENKAVFLVKFKTPEDPGLLWYHFVLEVGGRLLNYGAPIDGLGGEGILGETVPADWQITVYDADASVPRWYRDGIMYQVFVDRFARDKSQAMPPLHPGSVYHPHWEDTPFYTKDPKTGQIVAYDFFGGTLQGVIDNIPFLKSLGISVLYLNPIFRSVSNHKYDTGDYLQVDPQFGDDKVFQLLCDKAREAGICLILDGVFSHTGDDSLYFNRSGNYSGVGAWQSKDSPYYSWYRFEEYPDKYECWWGVTTLPNVNELDPAYRKFIITDDDSVIKHWIRAGARGWRLDVADELPGVFVREMYRELKATDPDAVLIGEVWEDASRKESYGELRQYLWGRELDSVINYPFRDAWIGFMLGRQSSGAALRTLSSLHENYPTPYFFATMNVLGSHDVPRILTLLGEADPEESLTKLQQSLSRLAPEARKLGIARLKLLALVQMTSPGVPCVYYGDEAGVEGYSDPFNRRPYPWGKEEAELVEWYRKLTGLRNLLPVLRSGEWIPLETSDNIAAYGRRTIDGRDVFSEEQADAAIIVVINRNPLQSETCRIDVNRVHTGPLTDLLDETASLAIPDAKGILELQLPPLSAKILSAAVHPLFAERSAGILLHITSLPGPWGVGDMGPVARNFVDWLADAKQRFWQVLPLNPAGFGDSPYQSPSAFAGNPLLISIEDLVRDGLLTEATVPAGLSGAHTDFASAKETKEKLLRQAFASFSKLSLPEDYLEFAEEHAAWLEDYCLFMALKSQNNDKPWFEWEKGLVARDPEIMDQYRRKLADDINFHRFIQYIFFSQAQSLKQYANGKDVRIIGDVPIFVAHDSADIWARQELCKLDASGHLLCQAGVPPDYFSKTGQLWGNPLYSWETHEKESYAWWSERLKVLFACVDAIRIDHFRGFDAHWEVPAKKKTAVKGKWMPGPGRELFLAMRRTLGHVAILAEDLGVITPQVTRLKDEFMLPGMGILQFSFEKNESGEPELTEWTGNTVAYSGTHDNDTLLGWLQDIQRKEPDFYRGVCLVAGLSEEVSPEKVIWPLLEVVWRSRARLAIIPLQDIQELGTEARMNRPSTVGCNWNWRLTERALTPALAKKLATATKESGRAK